MKAYHARGDLAPKPSGGRRHSKLEPHREFLLARVTEKNDITMPELAAELEAAHATRVDPASISRWLIRHCYRFKRKLCRPANKIVPTLDRLATNGWPTAAEDAP